MIAIIRFDRTILSYKYSRVFLLTIWLFGCIGGPVTSPPNSNIECSENQLLDQVMKDIFIEDMVFFPPIFKSENAPVVSEVLHQELVYYDTLIYERLVNNESDISVTNEIIANIGGLDTSYSFFISHDLEKKNGFHAEGNSGYSQFYLELDYINFISDYCTQISTEENIIFDEQLAENAYIYFFTGDGENKTRENFSSSMLNFAEQCDSQLMSVAVFHQIAHLFFSHIVTAGFDQGSALNIMENSIDFVLPQFTRKNEYEAAYFTGVMSKYSGLEYDTFTTSLDLLSFITLRKLIASPESLLEYYSNCENYLELKVFRDVAQRGFNSN